MINYRERSYVVKRYDRYAETPQDIKDKANKILNEFISKNREKHFNLIRNRIRKAWGWIPDEEIIENLLQEIYEYLCLSPYQVIEFNESGCMWRLFNTLVYHPSTLRKAHWATKKKAASLDEIEVDFAYEEDDYQWCDSLDSTLPIEERIEMHKLALDELELYLMDNPSSKLANALEMQKKCFGVKAWKVAFNFAATPNYKFLRDNTKALGIQNVQNYLDYFKNICSEVYGKEVKHYAQSPRKHVNK